MQNDRNPDAFTFQKRPAKNNTQNRHGKKIEADNYVYNLSAFDPNRKMNQQEQQRKETL